MVSVRAVLVHWLKMDAQKTYVLWLNRNTEEQAFSGRGARARQVAAHLSAEMRAVLANTDPPMRTTRRGEGEGKVADSSLGPRGVFRALT